MLKRGLNWTTIGVAVAVMLLGALYAVGPRVYAADDHTVESKAGTVEKDDSVASDAEPVAGSTDDLGGGQVEITSPTFKPPGSRSFKEFDGTTTHVDIELDPAGINPSRDTDTSSAIQISGTFTAASAGTFPLKGEGNMSGGGGGGGGQAVADTHWSAKVGPFVIDLLVDSDNDNGPAPPDGDEAPVEDTVPGKIVLANIDDDDHDEVPDYADLSSGTNEDNFTPLVLSLTLPDGVQATNVQVTFAYDGPAALPATIQGGGAFVGTDIGGGYTRYDTGTSHAKQGTIRLWNIESGASERTTDDYIVPGETYTADQLGLDGQNTTTLYIECINGSANARQITATTTITGDGASSADSVTYTALAPSIWVNCTNNSDNADALRNGTPDVAFTYNSGDDEAIEDQKTGFDFWWHGSESTTTLKLERIEDVMPINLQVPQVLVDQGFKFYLTNPYPLGPRPVAVRVYPAVSQSPLDYLQDETVAEQQMAADRVCGVIDTGTPQSLDGNGYAITGGDNPLVLTGQKNWTDDDPTIVLALVVEDAGGATSQISVDAVRITFRDPKTYWTLFSSRESGPTGTHTYPIEDGRTASIPLYPQAQEKRTALFAEQKNECLLHVHGYWASPTDLEKGMNIYYKRLFWWGYRGHLMALQWEGDELAPLFDQNVYNAFQTAPRLRELLLSVATTYCDGDVSNLDLSAHSLGVLVLEEAMRLQERAAGQPFAEDALAINGAVWRECFQGEQNLAYTVNPGPGYRAVDADDTITYTVDQLKQMSWRFWFRQEDNGSPRLITTAVEGILMNNYASEDYALDVMRLNDWNRLLFCVGHYDRDIDGYRTLVDDNDKHSMEHVPALMEVRDQRIFSNEDDLNWPIGARALAGYSTKAQSYNAPAETSSKWPIDSHDAYRSEPYPSIYVWYEELLPQLLTRGREHNGN